MYVDIYNSQSYLFDLIENDCDDIQKCVKLEKKIRDSSDTDENTFIKIHRSVIQSAIRMDCYATVGDGVKTRNMRLTALYQSIENNDNKCLLLEQIIQQIDQLSVNNCNYYGDDNIIVKQRDGEEAKEASAKRKAIYNVFRECVLFDYNVFVKEKSKEIKQIEWKKNIGKRVFVHKRMEDVEGEYENEKLLVKIVQLCLEKEKITGEMVTRNTEKFIHFNDIGAGDVNKHIF